MLEELPRRVVHASGSIIPLAYLAEFATWTQIRYLLAFGIVLALAIESVRLYTGRKLPIVHRMVRSYEEEHIAGYALYVIAGGGVGLVFEPTIAIPAIFMMTLADPIAGLISDDQLRPLKRPRVLMVMFVISTLLAWPFLEPIAAVAAASVATLADGAKPTIRGWVVDDNLSIPIGAAVTAYLVTAYIVPLL